MARDFDFVQRRRPQPVSRPTPRRSRRPNTISIAIFVGLVVLGVALLGNAGSLTKSHSTTSQPDSATRPSESSASSSQTATGDNSASTSIAPTLDPAANSPIQLYDSGAGDQTVKQTIADLATQHILVKNLGRSQFDYDRTYVWYATGKDQAAKDVVAALGNRQVTLKESTIAGSFDVLIYLGKN